LAKKISMSRARRNARRCALQAIYQWQVGGQDVAEIESQFLSGEDITRADAEYFGLLVRGVTARAAELDARLKPFLDRPVEGLDPVELAILRIGAYEFSHHPETPYRVVINEAVELAKDFGAEQSHRYVNGVLDKLARVLRRAEMKDH
jgi:N utilization substance protein B